MTFLEKLETSVTQNNSLLCIGLDPDITKLPKVIGGKADPLVAFNKVIIDATADLVCAFKPNSAFYEALGADGIKQLRDTTQYIHDTYPHTPILLDYKRGDIGNTNKYYAQFAFDYLSVDAITISPYMGKEANEAYLAHTDKGIFVLCRTSNPGAGEFQDLEHNGKKLYQIVAERIMNEWNDNKNCGLVIGSPYPTELATIRKLIGDDVLMLVPGAGTQGGDIEATVKAAVNASGTGVIINSSREIIYASNGADFAEAARAKTQTLKTEINKYR